MNTATLTSATQKPANRIAVRDEPFRLMFPVGIATGIFGVALWPLWIWDVISFYPGPAHARLMIGGFFGAMILGFLGTAGPRMLSARRLSNLELATIFSFWIGAVLAVSFNRIALADGLTALVCALGFFAGVRRFRERKDLPPPGFVMVVLGLLSGFAGTFLNFLVSLGMEWLPAPFVVGALGKLLYYQAFILLPILGIAPFFFPRFGGLPNPQASYPEFRRPTWDWTRRALLAAGFGIAVLGTFLWEVVGDARSAGVIRAVLVIGYILWQVPLRFPRGTVGTLGRVVQIATVLVGLGIALAALFPAYRIGLLHLLFVGGFNLITLCVANWVMFGHSGNAQRGRARLVYVRWGAGLILFALATRLSADFWTDARESHLAYAALVWMAGMAVWAWKALPLALKADEDEG